MTGADRQFAAQNSPTQRSGGAEGPASVRATEPGRPRAQAGAQPLFVGKYHRRPDGRRPGARGERGIARQSSPRSCRPSGHHARARAGRRILPRCRDRRRAHQHGRDRSRDQHRLDRIWSRSTAPRSASRPRSSARCGSPFDAIPASKLERCEGFGVSTPAQMDRHGLVRLAPLLGWRDVQLAELVRDALPVRVPVLAENDANAFAIGATYGRNEVHSGVTLFLVMESGVGGGIIIDGSLFRGANGLAGEIGHLIVSGAPGPRRNLEQVIGLESIMADLPQDVRRRSSRHLPISWPTSAARAERRLDCRGMGEGAGARPRPGLPDHRCRPDRARRVGCGALSPDGRAAWRHTSRRRRSRAFRFHRSSMNDEGTVGSGFRRRLHAAPALSVGGKPAFRR